MMKRMNMKGKFFAALLVCLTVGLWAAPAMARPNWVSFTYSKWTLYREKESKKWYVYFKVTYRNDSKDRIVTEIFNKTIENVTLGIYSKAKPKDGRTFWYNDNPVKEVEVKVGSYSNSRLGWSNVDKVNLYPGQTHTLSYKFYINNVTVPEKVAGAKILGPGNTPTAKSNEFNWGATYIKNLKWYHDYHVKSMSMLDSKKVFID